MQQVVIVDPKTASLKEDSKQEAKEMLAKIVEKLPELLPYLAAFGFGAIVGYQNEKKFEGALRVGAEAVIFYQLAKGLPSSSLVPNPAQVFGVLGLTSIGLSAPTKDFIAFVSSEMKKMPWIYPAGSTEPGIDITPLIDWINTTWTSIWSPKT